MSGHAAVATGRVRRRVPADEHPRLMRRAALLATAAVVVEFTTEHLAAAAWTQPGYSFARDPVSDLGNPVPHDVIFGTAVNSPRFFVANAGFLVFGVLAGAALLTIRRVLNSRRDAVALALLGLLPLAMLDISVFSQQSRFPLALRLHEVGAGLLCLCTLGAATIGILGVSLPTPRWYRAVSLMVGLVGFTSFALLVTAPVFGQTFGAGTMERILLWGLYLWLLVTAAGLMRMGVRRSPVP